MEIIYETNNRIDGNYHGINLNEARKNNLIQNLINNNSYGISLTSSYENNIMRNIMYYNNVCIIETDYCPYNVYEDNDCGDTGTHGDTGLDWTLLLILTGSVSLIVIVMIEILWHYRKK